MADHTVDDPLADFNAIPIPPLDDAFFSDDLYFSDYNFISFDDNGDVLNLDFTFDDINLPSDLLHSTFSDSIPVQIPSDPDVSGLYPKSSEFCLVSSSDSGYKSSDVVPKLSSSDAGGFLNVSSSDSPYCSLESGNKPLGVSRVFNCASPVFEARNREFSVPTSSQGSDNCARSVGTSPGNNSISGIVDQKIKLQEPGKNYLLKRKKETGDVNSESKSKRTIQSPRSNVSASADQSNHLNEAILRSNVSASADQSNHLNEAIDEEEKRKARLIRNRESAQLSRQRKKHYVEELEDKVRAMHSTIQDLNAKISYIVAENATLRQQMNCGGAVGHLPMPGFYPPMAPMGYPWMPYPPYVVKSRGSQVPLVPIPRLKSQQQPVKTNNKKTEGKSKTKKVASVSFLGLLFFILVFGGLVPMVDVKYGGIRDAFSVRSDYIEDRFYDQHHHSRVLMVSGTNHDRGTRISNKNFDAWKNNNNNTLNCARGHVGGTESSIKQSSSEECARSANASEPLVASLYVPRNDKLVKIDGNLIIHSVLASEKAMASHEDRERKSTGGTSLALAPTISIPGVGQNNGRHPHLYRITAEQQRAFASGSASKNSLKSTPIDSKLQQWFQEGLAGPMLSSGMCTEVFQFDVSPTPGAMIPATSVRNISMAERRNSTLLNKVKNRRILHGLPIPLAGAANNISKENTRSNSQKENSHRNSSLSPIIVSVLVDPREVGDADGAGMMGTKPLSRIFVVILLDSVRYVTYSCMLPFKGSNHLVTA